MLKMFFNIILSKYQLYKISKIKGLTLKGKLIIKGYPIISIASNAQIVIGNNVTLNSKNKGYHTALYSPVKLFADRKQASISIGDNTRIHGTCIHACESITIGSNCLIAANTNIFDSNGHDLSFGNVSDRIHTKGTSKPIIIEDNVWIGINSIILPGVKIGEGSIIAAGSVVTKEVLSNSIVGGNPAVLIKRYIDINHQDVNSS